MSEMSLRRSGALKSSRISKFLASPPPSPSLFERHFYLEAISLGSCYAAHPSSSNLPSVANICTDSLRASGSPLSLPIGHDPSRVGQVRPVASCGQVGDLDPSLVKSRNLSRVGQVRPADSCGQVRNIDPSGSK